MLNKEYWKDVFNPAMILKTSLQTIIGSVLVGSFFMVFSDYIFQPLNMNGRWELTLEPTFAVSNTNRCVNITYSVLFMQKGVNLLASGEKILDKKSSDKECISSNVTDRKIPPGKGKRIDLTGFIQNNYFTPDVLTISYKEGAPNKQRFTIGSLKIEEDELITGKYDSNISRAEGKITLRRVYKNSP